MKKIILLSFLLGVTVAQAQVGFGTPTPDLSAEVEIKATDKGVLIPRIALTSTTQKLNTNVNNADALLVFNNGTDLPQGFYYWKANFDTQNQNDGTGSWIAVGSETSALPKFFYMPSIVINTSANGSFTRNLHAEYKAQFTGQLYDSTNGTFHPNPDFVKSDGAPNVIPNLPNATDLYYYITDYDKTALTNLSIDVNGILTYDVIGSGTDYSFVNIVFVVK